MPHQQVMNLFLRDRVVSQRFAHVHTPGGGRDQRQHILGDQPIVHHHLGLFQPVQRAQRHQVGRSRPGANDADRARSRCLTHHR